jgi:hypothetical protein
LLDHRNWVRKNINDLLESDSELKPVIKINFYIRDSDLVGTLAMGRLVFEHLKKRMDIEKIIEEEMLLNKGQMVVSCKFPLIVSLIILTG